MTSPQPTESPLSTLSDESLRAALASLELAERRDRISRLFPAKDDEARGLIARDKHAKHLQFFAQGREHQERCFMAANRVGKTIVGAYETALHLTGDYPEWWEGRRFEGPGDWWAAGDTSETTRDIVQLELLGPSGDHGTGMIPWRCFEGEPVPKRGIAGAIDTVAIKHKSGGVSTLGFKSYDQGRKKFQGTKKQGIWLDEEPPADVYDECLLRLMTTDGLMLCTFTPLEGLSEVALRFLPHLAPAPPPAPRSW